MNLVITKQQAEVLANEGVKLREEYRKRVHKMHSISVEKRLTKCL